MKRFLLTILLVSTSMMFGAPSDLDISFSTDGYDLLDNGSNEYFHKVVIDGNDKVVAIGQSNSEAFVARYNNDGILDTAGFANPAGYAAFSSHISTGGGVHGDVDSSNNIVFAGTSNADSTKIRIVKVLADGTGLDTTGFNSSNGYIDITIDGSSTSASVSKVIVDSNDKIVLIGSFNNGSKVLPFVARVLADGTALDTGFNGTGLIKETNITTGSNGAHWKAGVIDGSNRIVVTGDAKGLAGGQETIIARYTDAGAVESAFGNVNSVVGTGGIRVENISGSTDADQGLAIAIAAGDKIVVAGHAIESATNKSFVAQFDATNGALDTSFNTTGKHIFTVNSSRFDCNDMVIDAEGRIIIVGDIAADQEAIVRFDSDGAFDSSFGSSGVSYNFDATNTLNLKAAALQSNGKVIIAGSEGGGNQLYIARMLSGYASEVDTTFDSDGFLTTVSLALSSEQPELRSVFVLSDNKMFIVEQNQKGTPEVVIHKLNEDGTAIAGNFPMTITSESNPADIIEDADGKILIVGGQAGEWMYRYNADGTLDATFNNGVTPGYRSSATDKQFGVSGRGEHVVQQSNGRYLVVGSDGTDGKILAIASDGTVDSSFGSSGIYTLSGADIDDVVVSDLNEIFIAYEGGTNIEIAKIQNDGSGLDTSYGTSGVYDTGLAKATYTNVSKIALDSSGKVVLVNVNSSTKDIVCYRATTGGGADANGTFTAAAHGVTAPIISKMQATESDQVVIAGYESGAIGHFVARLNSSLAADTGFGVDGIKNFAIDQWNASSGVIHDLEVSPSGNIIVVGYEDDGASNYTDFVARLTGDANIGQVVRFPNVDTVGNVDLFFGVNGELDLNGTASLGNGDSKSMHILSDGKILLAVQNSDGSTTDLVKLDASYAADGTFNGGSRVQFATSEDLRFVDTDVAGNILLCGGDGTSGSDAAWLHKVQSDGSAHATFASPTDVIDKAYKVVEQSSGRLIVAGLEDGVATLIAYSPVTGDVDTSFGTNGRYTVAGISNPIVDIAVDTATDQLLIAYMDGSSNARVKKLMPNAKAEVSGFSFGTPIGSVAASDQIKMRVLSTGKIAVVTRNGASFRLRRYLAAGGNDVSEVTVSSTGLNNLRDVIALSDGKLIVVGETSSNDVVIARMDGSLALDTTFNPTAGFSSKGLTVMTDFMAVDIESDGNILIAGS